MTERAYTVSEIDALRRAVETKWLFGSYYSGTGMSRSYRPEEKAVAVEQMVRTHMLAGHTAEDLYASESVARTKADFKTVLKTANEPSEETQ